MLPGQCVDRQQAFQQSPVNHSYQSAHIMPGLNWIRSWWLLLAQHWCRKLQCIRTSTAWALQAWHSILLQVPHRNWRFTFDATGQPVLHRTRAWVSIIQMAHTTLHKPMVSVGFLDAKRFIGIMMLQHTQKKPGCVWIICQIWGLSFLPQAWNLSVLVRHIEIKTKALRCYLSVQDLSTP